MPKDKRNPCKFCDPLLSVCSGVFAPDGCKYMDKPETCFAYEDKYGKAIPLPAKKPSHTPPPIELEAQDQGAMVNARKQDEKLETPLDFVGRVEKELHRLGVETEREEAIKLNNPDEPIMPPDF